MKLIRNEIDDFPLYGPVLPWKLPFSRVGVWVEYEDEAEVKVKVKFEVGVGVMFPININ